MLLSKSGTIPSLTGLRFIAALMVFFSHFPLPEIHHRLTVMQTSGYAGVTFFFVLSGFIIAVNYLDAFEKSPLANTYNYLISRLARVYPLYIFCILFVWISRGANSDITPYLLATQAWNEEYWIAFGLVSQSWSISVEIFLYLTFPLIIPALKYLKVISSQYRLLAFIAFLVFCQFALAYYFSASGLGLLPATNPDSAHRWLYRTPITRILDFALGISAAIYYRRHLKITSKTIFAAEIATYASIACILALMSSSQLLMSPYSFDAMYALPFMTLIASLAVARNTRVSKILSTQKFILLGEASFALYLLQAMLSSIYIQQPTQSALFSIINELFYLIVLIATSIGLHLMIEKPAQRLIRKLLIKKSKTTVAAAPMTEPKTVEIESIAAAMLPLSPAALTGLNNNDELAYQTTDQSIIIGKSA